MIKATAISCNDLLPPSVLLIFAIHLRSNVDEDSIPLVVSPQPVLEGHVIDNAFET